MPRAFLITNKRYESLSTSTSTSLDQGQQQQTQIHSRENSPERSVNTAEERELVIGSEAESNLKPSSPGSPARLFNRISVLSHTALFDKSSDEYLNQKEYAGKDSGYQITNSVAPLYLPKFILHQQYLDGANDEDDEFEDQAQDLSLNHLRTSFSGPENPENSSSSLSSCSPLASPYKQGSEKSLLSSDIHICPDCGKRYSTSSNLARHRQTHRSVTDKKARKCPHCDKVYVSMPAYSMHVRTHTQGCVCSFCGKCFSRPWLLQGHIRTHTGEKPFKCPICSKAFADKSNLRAHVQTHSTTKPYVCQRCGKAFALKSYLYKHEESSCMRMHRQSNGHSQRSVSMFIDSASARSNVTFTG